MKKLFNVMRAFALCGTLSLTGEIIETNEISTVLDYVSEDSLLFLNVTGTMYEPSNALADHQWRVYLSNRIQEIVKDPKVAQILIDQTKNMIVQTIPKKTVEEKTPQLITELQANKIAVLGVTQKGVSTSYADNFAGITQKHLQTLGIHLEKSLETLKIKEGQKTLTGYAFVDGILFTNKKPIGPAIVEFLDTVEPKHARVIAVDNSLSSLDNLEKSLDLAGVKFVGLHYRRAEAQTSAFDPVLGTIEFFSVINEGKIISDADALELKQNLPHVNHEEVLDEFIRMRAEELAQSAA